ncbi:MAG: DUF2281 domain-containing protein [Candidatus Xenobia bacterium]
MEDVTIPLIEERLKQLPHHKLTVVYDFVSYLADQQTASPSFQTMLASEAVLAHDWNTPEEDEAWRDL